MHDDEATPELAAVLFETQGIVAHGRDMADLNDLTRESVEASLDRSLADLAAGRTHDLDETIASLEAEADVLERLKALAGDRVTVAASEGVAQGPHG